MDTYLFSVFTAGLFHWDTLPQKQPYKIIGMTSSIVMLRGNKEGLLQLKILRPHDGLIGALSYFIENKSLNLYFVCPFTMRLDVLGCASSYQRSLKENGVLLKEYDLIHFLNIWRERVQFLPDSSLQCSDVITNSCDLVMRSESPPPYDERCAMSSVGKTPEFHGFGVFDNEFSYTQGFTKVDPTKLTKLRGNRLSLIFLPASAPMNACISTVLDMAKKLESQTPEPYMEDGRRVRCSLILDEFAHSVDTRLLTPGNLEILGVLVMKPSEYFAWAKKSEEKYQTLESSVALREAVFKSTLDFRFSPPAFMYQWRVFAFNSVTRITGGTLPQCDWTAIIINSSPLDYCKKSLSFYVMNQVRNAGMFRGTLRFEYFNSIERSMFRVPFAQKMSVRIHACEVANQYEKTLEKSFKEKPEDHFMATMGFLKSKPVTGFFPASEPGLNNAGLNASIINAGLGEGGAIGHAQKKLLWSEKLFNLRIRKTAGFIYSEFVEDCFEGFALESAREILSCNASDCCICCTNTSNVVLEACGHSFCQVCLNTMLDGTTNQGVGGKVWEPCPTCRAPFSKETMVQFKAYKTTRRKARENSSLTRKRALLYLLERGADTEKKEEYCIDKSPMVLDEEETAGEISSCGVLEETSMTAVSSRGEASKALPTSPARNSALFGMPLVSKSSKNLHTSTLLVVPYDAAVDKVMEWCPGIHCVSLQKLNIMASWQKMTRIILVSPHLNLESLEKFHGILQCHSAPVFTLEIISLNFGSFSCEDISWTSSLVEDYGCHEKSISALVL
jgi:hypothetical protein